MSKLPARRSLGAGGEAPSSKLFKGIIVKAAMKDTATVLVERYVMHPKYKKYLRRGKKYLVHDPGNTVQIGDKVTIREARPISKRKHFVIVSKLDARS